MVLFQVVRSQQPHVMGHWITLLHYYVPQKKSSAFGKHHTALQKTPGPRSIFAHCRSLRIVAMKRGRNDTFSLGTLGDMTCLGVMYCTILLHNIYSLTMTR